MTKLIAATTLILMLTSAADAGSWIKIERPCGSKCAPPQPARVMSPSECCAVGSVRFRDLSKTESSGSSIMVGASNQPDYESRSRMVVRSLYGTSVINSTFRSYSR
jgi:hypothetical protein